MARNKVDLPEPEGPVTNVLVPASIVSRSTAYDLAPVRQTQYKITQHQIASRMLSPFDARRFRAKPTRLVDGRAKCRQTFDDSFVGRERLVACDKESERGFNPAKGAGRLRHLSKGDLPEEKVGRDNNIGDHHVGLKIGRCKRQKLQGAADDGIKVRHDCAEPAAQYPPFGILAAEQCHLLAVFTQAGQREPKIGLVALLPELEPNKWLANQMGQPGANE